MSTVYVINPQTGRIIRTLCETASYRTDEGIVIKPSPAEELRILHISQEAERISRMQEEIQALDRQMQNADFVSSQLEEMRARRKHLAANVQQKEKFAQAVMNINRLRSRAAELKQIAIDLPTSCGVETVTLSLDEYTGNAYTQLTERLDQLSDACASDDPQLVHQTMLGLVEVEEALEALPGLAIREYLRWETRVELANSAVERLAENGWAVTLDEQGDASLSTRLSLANSIGDRATLVFAPDDSIQLETPGLRESARAALQQLVINALQACGAEDAVGRCMDRESESQQWQAPAAALDAESIKERLRQ